MDEREKAIEAFETLVNLGLITNEAAYDLMGKIDQQYPESD